MPAGLVADIVNAVLPGTVSSVAAVAEVAGGEPSVPEPEPEPEPEPGGGGILAMMGGTRRTSSLEQVMSERASATSTEAHASCAQPLVPSTVS
jgi:hypothetical protein